MRITNYGMLTINKQTMAFLFLFLKLGHLNCNYIYESEKC